MSKTEFTLAATSSSIGTNEAVGNNRSRFWPRIERFLERAGEWLNPLLVKECRQALKSRQFSIWFTLVLALCWLWTIVAVARLGPDVAYRFEGPGVFFGYYLILAVPLIIIVPFFAFRSLITEREDNTYELVAITTLKPRQIVSGKLGSAVAQMLVYLSAVAPCLAFTYLLRGIDVLTICFVLAYTFLASLGLSVIALLIATIAKEKYQQVVVSVAIVLGLAWAFSGMVAITGIFLGSRWSPFNDSEFIPVVLLLLSIYGTTFLTVYLAAAAQLTFTADNRSSPLRKAMLLQQAVFAGWIGYIMFSTMEGSEYVDRYILPTSLVIAVIYWAAMGAMMLGENTVLSPRVKRGLPTSFLGRLFGTWFNPGPGPGYLFTLANFASLAGLTIFATYQWVEPRSAALANTGMVWGPTTDTVFWFCLLLLGYLTIYLGLANLLLLWIRRFSQVTLLSSVLLVALWILLGWGGPWILRLTFDPNSPGYTMLHITDPFWTPMALLEPRVIASSFAIRDVPPLVLSAAAIVLFFNLLLIAPAVREVRIATPQRVREEEAELAVAEHPEKPQPSNPWD